MKTLWYRIIPLRYVHKFIQENECFTYCFLKRFIIKNFKGFKFIDIKKTHMVLAFELSNKPHMK